MYSNYTFYILTVLSLLSSDIQAQENFATYPKFYFSAPLNLKPAISGTFGDLRKNHFHAGLDYRTNRQEGYPVYAVANGFVSRYKVQLGGFGNALYIDHPNGYTSVYAHLKQFSNRIATEVSNCQYLTQSFTVDYSLPNISIPVKKGEIIGWSGNSGGSEAPHLHLEIRDTKTEEIINPELFGLALPDFIKPEIKGLYVYQLDEQAFSEQTPKQFFSAVGVNGKYTLNSTIITPSNKVGLGILAFDKKSASDNKHNIYSINVSMDGQTIFAAHWDRFSFNHSRAINSYIDYPTYIRSGIWIYKNFVEPNNALTIYDHVVNNGLIQLHDSQIHHIKYTLKDIAGNTSTFVFRIKRAANYVSKNSVKTGPNIFKCKQINTFNTPDIKIVLPQNTLYSDLDFKYATSKGPTNSLSDIHHIHHKFTPLNDTISVWVKPKRPLDINLQEKALLVNSQSKAEASYYHDGFVKASLKTFGSFYIAVDTIAPKVVPINIVNGKQMQGISKIVFTIIDNLSGIKAFTGTIDEQWVLMEYDPKTATLWHTFDKHLTAGEHHFLLTVEDQKSNKKTYQATFFR